MDQNYSVLMSVYDKEKPEYLRQAIRSMMEQTAPADDFVIVCDGPLTEELDSVIAEAVRVNPKVFQIVRLEENKGLGNALNEGLQKCRNDLVARMDSDDIALPERCIMQLHLFEDTRVALSSGHIAEFDETPSDILSTRKVPIEYRDILKFAKRRNPMNHMAVMFRKSAVCKVGGYIEVSLAEDYYLWARMLKAGYYAENIDQILVYARTGNGMYARRGGISYAKSIYELEKMLLQINFISYLEFIQNCTIRILGSIVPVGVRKALYQYKLRR